MGGKFTPVPVPEAITASTPDLIGALESGIDEVRKRDGNKPSRKPRKRTKAPAAAGGSTPVKRKSASRAKPETR